MLERADAGTEYCAQQLTPAPSVFAQDTGSGFTTIPMSVRAGSLIQGSRDDASRTDLDHLDAQVSSRRLGGS
jgi:hypothetical protein